MASPKLRAFRGALLYRALLVISAIGRLLPLGAARFLGRALGRIAWHLVRRERRKALRNIAIAFPDVERGAAPQHDPRDVPPPRHVRLRAPLAAEPRSPDARLDQRSSKASTACSKLIDAGRGVICLTAHCGNWEWLAT